MPSSTFHFRSFSINQDRCAMKVGTDGVLLGAWAHLDASCHTLLDIGTGTGLLALMMAQRLNALTPFALTIDAVEIDPQAAEQATQNAQASPWASSIHVIPSSLDQAEDSALTQAYDRIVCNPPFYDATLKPEDSSRAVARHKDSLPVAQIMRYASHHLRADGRLALIYPTAYDTEVFTAATLHSLHPQRICDVFTKVGKSCKRRMAEFGLSAPLILLHEDLAIRDTDGSYTRQYRTLTQPFYLHLSD